jgi:MATE family multidrug resistance protein
MTELIALAWPITAAMFGETALGLCDTKLVGALGASALGGVGMATMLLFLSYAMIFGLMRGVKVRAAYAVGEGRPADAVRYAEAGALLGAATGVVIWVLTRDVTPVLHALRLEESMVPYARDFVAARSWGAIGTCATAALINYL